SKRHGVDMNHSEDSEQNDDADHRDAREGDAFYLALLRGTCCRGGADRAQRWRHAQLEHDDANDHADASRAESPVPANALTEIAGDQWCDQRAGIDTHVEDREASISARTAFRIEIADSCRHVRLEHSGAQHDEYEADEKRGVREHRRQRYRDVSAC